MGKALEPLFLKLSMAHKTVPAAARSWRRRCAPPTERPQQVARCSRWLLLALTRVSCGTPHTHMLT